MRHSSVVCTVTVYTPSGVPPCKHSGSHYSPHPWQKRLQTQAASTVRTKAMFPNLTRAVQNTEKVWIASYLETYIFLASGHCGYGSSSFCWIITVEWNGMWFILNQITTESTGIKGFSVAQFSALVWKKRQGTSSLTQTLADLLTIGSNRSLVKIKTRCERPTGELCCGFERHMKCSFPERYWNIFLSVTV